MAAFCMDQAPRENESTRKGACSLRPEFAASLGRSKHEPLRRSKQAPLRKRNDHIENQSAKVSKLALPPAAVVFTVKVRSLANFNK